MENQLNKLDPKERHLLVSAPALVSYMAAAADGKFDRRERMDAIEMAHLRTFTAAPELRTYYKEAEIGFRKHLDEVIRKFEPLDLNRSKAQQELKAIYDILDKMDPYFKVKMKESLKSYAKHVATIHPGFSDFFDFSVFKIHP